MQEKILSPYQDQVLNETYNRLFCDNPNLLKDEFEAEYAALFGMKPQKAAIRAVVEKAEANPRIRMLAANMLRDSKSAVKENKVLGVVVEVGFPEGLETLAVYADGRIDYISSTGQYKNWQVTGPAAEQAVNYMIYIAQQAVESMPPINHNRMYPPFVDMARFSILSTWGMYVGQGTVDSLQKDKVGKNILTVASDILVGVSGKK